MMSKTREEAVWKRVMALSAEAPAPSGGSAAESAEPLTEDRVLTLLTEELSDACTYRTLAARAKGDLRRGLLGLAREELRHSRRLEAVYYVMTGKRPCPDRPKAPCVACLNEELRRCYAEEIEGAACYGKLAQTAGSFAHTFRCLALEEEAHSRRLLNLLERYL